MLQKSTSRLNQIFNPFLAFIKKEKAGGMALGISVILALIIANSPLAGSYYHILETEIGLYFNDQVYLRHDVLHWINDGLMAVFFFVVGLELKREIVGGELSSPSQALLPIGAAVGGMLVPALIYLALNAGEPTARGWGIPMATDIAFALGVLHLVGDRIPAAAKVFLAALAIVDDLGAVLVIALFYTSDISVNNLLLGLGFVLVMYGANKAGVRNLLFYALTGIFGVWLAFMSSGIHPTIAAVLAAFTIPADVIIKETDYTQRVEKLLKRFKALDPDHRSPALTHAQLDMLDHIKEKTNAAIPPLQRLEHALHPFVSLFVLPVFALANAGVDLDIDFSNLFENHIATGVFFGLLAGKLTGVVGFSYLMKWTRLAVFPRDVNFKTMAGLGLLAAIGFTMSLFITTLAFKDAAFIDQAKIGIFAASITGGITGYLILKKGISGRQA